jgi:ribosomal protein L22
MKNQKIFKLIDGKFSSDESREILQNVFSRKIQFHQIKNFSSRERFGKDDETALVRIPQLNKSLNDIIKIIREAEKNGEQIEIKSEVIISTYK